MTLRVAEWLARAGALENGNATCGQVDLEKMMRYIARHVQGAVKREREQEYKDKPESNYLSYSRLIYVSDSARAVANYRMQGMRSEKYIPYTSSNNVYTKETTDKKINDLLNNVNETLFILKNLE